MKVKNDITCLRMAIQLANNSKKSGNLPFGCILVNQNGEIVLRGENTINSDRDCLAHAEINLIREASKAYDFSYLNNCTIFTSVEPCPMCTSAIYWSGIGRLVYALDKAKYYDIVGRENPNWLFEMPTRELLQKGGRKIEVIGPLLQIEAYDEYLKM
ncbi:nucleoside deaminase [Allomuricauda sp. CP2A]|uniref:nucleoside deaminase n=1 Tax=Allomuricauda sp. CP2A TaxID=1848189 RepID=UPI000831BA3A|nr:nucleoside deaminase [Muricauda sp. CP2A]